MSNEIGMSLVNWHLCASNLNDAIHVSVIYLPLRRLQALRHYISIFEDPAGTQVIYYIFILTLYAHL